MKASDIFELAVRIAGFILVLIGVVRLILMVPYFIHPLHGLDGMDLPTEAMSIAVMAVLGVLLLFGGRAITRIVYRN